MLNIVSIIIGIVALLLATISFIPFLGLGNWFVVPIAMVGALVGFLSRSKTGRNLNLIVIVIAIIRLSLGGGIF